MQTKRKTPPTHDPPPRQAQPRPSSSIPSAPSPSNGGLLPNACVMASLDVDPVTGIDPILYKGPKSPDKMRFQRKPPHLDRRREYEANANSHKGARATVAMLSERHAQRQIELEETFERDAKAEKFLTTFLETRLATCGEPTLNTMDVRIARERDTVNNTSSTARQRAKSSTDNRIRQMIRQAYGSGVLDLKSLELVHIPDAVYSTLLLQLGRFISHVNISRNALREIPTQFVMAFPQATIVNYKENALDRLPRAIDKLTSLKELTAECNQLRMLPVHLPSTLQQLVLSRNRLTNIPHMHELLHLVELDLSYNHFQLLPPGMPYLSRLTKLVMNSNRLVSLALLPKYLIPEKSEKPHGDSSDDSDDAEDEDGIESWSRERIDTEQKKWRVESDPLTGDTVYFHVTRKRVARVKPRCFRSQVPMLAINKTAAAAKLKKSHAQWIALFPDGWEVTVGGVCINKDSGHRPRTMTGAMRPETTASRDGTTAGELQSMELCFTHHLTDQSFYSIPDALDKWTELHRITSLHLSGNQLLDLPPSIGKLVRLKLLDLENNKILALPDTFHEMKALETIKLAMNALSWLPPSFCLLPNLTDLDIKLNRFRGLPEEFGSLPRLKTLDLSSNSLESLPKSMLSLKKLTTLRIQGNQALVRSGLLHAETLASGDIPQIFWHLSHQVLVEQVHGGQLPPVSESVVVGVGDEVWSTNHHVHRAFTQAIAQAQVSHSLDFHWKNVGFSKFPQTFFTSLSGLKELRLSGQDLDTIPVDFARVCGCLRVLQLRKNRIRVMDDGVFNCEGMGALPLVELDLEYNQLELLPLSIGNLAALRSLRACNNHLHESSFPDSFAKLTALKELHLTHNRLSQPSPTFGSLVSLEKLDLSYNQLTTLSSMVFASLRCLYQLRVSVNQLVDIPEELANAPIQELFIAGNRLQELPSTVLLLKNSLRVLRMQSNKISRLPLQFGELTALEIVQADGNPFRSPPPEVMNMDIKSIRKYLHKRHERVTEIQRLLDTVRFPYIPETFLEPKLAKLLARDQPEATKFLTEKHFCAFEKAVDAYVNGAFYLLPATLRGADLVTELLLQKQFYLAQQHRAGILRDLVKLCALIRDKKWLDKVDFRFDLQRPWGRLGEVCGVYALNPRALYDDQPALPSVLSVIKTRVYHGFEDEAFTHSEHEVADAIENYLGVYGPVGVIHDEVPFKCGCEDLLRFNKKHEPCYRPGWSFVQVVYTQEEADRRVSDEETIQEALRALRPQISTFLKTQEGEKRFHAEVKKIKNSLRTELKAKKQKLKKLKRKYEPLKVAQDKAKKKEQEMPSKETKTLAQVTEEQEREEKIKALGERVAEMAQEYEKGKQQLGQGYSAFMEDVVTVLMEKIGVEVRNHLVQQQRQRAIDFGLRRPWDGPNGRDFEMYKQLVRRKMLGDGSMEKEAATPEAVKDSASPAAPEDGEDRTSDNSEISDVSFDGYEDLVSNLTAPGAEDADGGDNDDDDDDDDDEDDDVNEAERAEALAKIEVSDISADSEDEEADAAAAESEDSEL